MIFFVVDMCYLLAFSNEYFIFLSHSEALLLFFLSDDVQISISMGFHDTFIPNTFSLPLSSPRHNLMPYFSNICRAMNFTYRSFGACEKRSCAVDNNFIGFTGGNQ
jgi:hypothetical protein